jgi:hypothetical protein
MTQTPRLPPTVYSPLGAFRVVVEPLPDDSYGEVDYCTRTVTIAPNLLPPTQLHTLMHEMMHVAIHESGLDEMLDHSHEELLCTTIGKYLAGAILSGHLILTVKK